MIMNTPPLFIPAPPQLPGPPLPAEQPGGAAWVGVLERVHWPADVVVLDWETYFDAEYSLKKLSTIEYIEHKQFEGLGMACLTMRGDLPHAPRRATFWADVKGQLEWLQSQHGQNLERVTVVMHNARFDGTILIRKFGIAPPYLVDTLALSRHIDARNSHHLSDLCERWNLPAKGDTMQFKGHHWADMSAEERAALANYSCNDAEREADLFALLLPRLTRPELELWLMRHTMRLYWEPELEFDFAEAERLSNLMMAQVAKETEIIGVTPQELSGNLSFAKLLGDALAETGETIPMKMGKRGPIAALAKDDNAIAELKRHRNPRVRALLRGRQAVKSWPLHVRRLGAMSAQARAAGGRLPNPLNYYGAHTGRWSGGEGINTCNLPTRGGGLACEIKHCLVAPRGQVFIMADAAQIEARGVAWLANQADLLTAFAEGRDVYSEFAADTLATPCRKPMKSDPLPVAALYSARRALGKVGILGMGYGMGANRALEYMETYPELAPQIEAGEINQAFCKRFVDSYRSRYRQVPKLWRSLEDAFRYTTRYNQLRNMSCLTLSREGTTTIIGLPSGRSLFYPHAAVQMDGSLRFHWGPLWGGTLTENIVQAMSRDILAEAIKYIEDHGFRVVHHCYDSVVVSVPEAQQTIAYACVCEAFTKQLTWAPEWPLAVEAMIGRHYE